MIVLDTDVCVAILRGAEPILQRRAAVAEPVATTIITAGELFYGAAKSKDPGLAAGAVAVFLGTLPVLGISPQAARRFGDLKADLERAGTRLDDADLWIAAIALEHDAPVATGNVRHYQRVSELRLDNWFAGVAE